MTAQDIFAFLKQKFGTMVLFGALVGALAFFLLMVTEKRFQTSTDFLVVQTNTANQDFYTQFKSSEYLGKILSEAVFSERFIDAVIATGKINAELLPSDKKERLEHWSKMISVHKNLELGMLSVTVKSNSERDTVRITDGIAQVLTEQNMLFRGGEQGSVDIRILSGPITERNPEPAKIALVSILGFLAGFLLTAAVLFFRIPQTTKREEVRENISEKKDTLDFTL